MSKKTKPKVSKAALTKALNSLEENEKLIKELTKKQNDLRIKIADFFHEGEDGTQNFEIHGYEVKVVRRLSVTCSKEAQEQLAVDEPDIYEDIFPEKVVRTFDSTKAKHMLDELEDYVTTKQGLPTVTFKRL